MSNTLFYLALSLFASGSFCACYGQAGAAAIGFMCGFFSGIAWFDMACQYKKKVREEEYRKWSGQNAKSTAQGIGSSGETFDAVVRVDANTGAETVIRSAVGAVKTDFELEIKTGI